MPKEKFEYPPDVKTAWDRFVFNTGWIMVLLFNPVFVCLYIYAYVILSHYL